MFGCGPPAPGAIVLNVRDGSRGRTWLASPATRSDSLHLPHPCAVYSSVSAWLYVCSCFFPPSVRSGGGCSVVRARTTKLLVLLLVICWC